MKRIASTFLLFLLVYTCSHHLYGQSKKNGYASDPFADSLLFALQNAIGDSAKLDLYRDLGYYFEGNPPYSYEKAARYADTVLMIAKKIKNKKQEAHGWNILGQINFDKGNLLESLNSACMAWQDEHLAEAHMAMGNYAEALKYAQLSLKIAELIKMVHTVAYNTIGDIYQLTGEFDQAVTTYNMKIEYLDSLKNRFGTDELCGYIACYIGIGNIFTKKGEYSQALKNLNFALGLEDQCSYPGQSISLYTALGNTYQKIALSSQEFLAKKYFESSVYYFTKALKLCDSVKLKTPTPQLYAGLSLTYYRVGDYQKAYYYSSLLSNYRDSALNGAAYKKVSELTTAYEKEKSDALEKLSQEKRIAEQKSRRSLLTAVAIAVVIVSIFSTLWLRQRSQKRKAIANAENVHKMAELELQSLRSQLNPHFMFNSLNSLQRLILMEDSDKSQSYLARFSKMLRMLLENADKTFIPLQKEIDFLQLYLGLEKLRIPDLEYSISTDPILNTEETLIPNMILQPYVENAIWHGLSHKEKDRQLQIRISRENGSLNCEIEDNGVGRKKAEELKSLFRKQHQSKGMELLTKRFKLLNEKFGSEIHSSITDLKKDEQDCGVIVSVKVPMVLAQLSEN
jgi:hypothetical protein